MALFRLSPTLDPINALLNLQRELYPFMTRT